MARILVVDDEADMRMALGNVISRMGHQVYEAGDGPAALEFMAAEGADLVLLDIRLPGMDGVQILRKLRETDGTTPVIMVTGYGSVESAVEVMQLGASHYLAKPFSNQELRDTVERVLAGERASFPGTPSAKLSPDPKKPAAGVLENPKALMARPARYEAAPDSSWQAPALLLVCAALALGFWRLLGGEPGREIPISHANTTALAWSGDRLWSADWLSQSVYESREAGGGLEAVRSFPLPRTHITGMAVSDDYIFLCDSWKKVIQQRRRDENLTLVRSVPSPGPNPSGLFWDGRYLWSSDGDKKRFYQHEPEAELGVLASYRTPGRAPSAIYKDDKYFWSADSESRMIYQHRLDDKLGVLAAYSLERLDQGASPLSTFTWKGKEVWLARDGERNLLVRPLSAFAKMERRRTAP